MLLHLDFGSDVPIYMQIRNQVVLGIADGALAPGDKLPTIRLMADEAGINMMTVSRAYQLLKQEGYISTDRRSGAVIRAGGGHKLAKNSLEGLRVIASEAKASGMDKEEFLALAEKFYDGEEIRI